MKPLYNGMIPPSMVRRLADLWPDGKHVVLEYGEGASDEDVWKGAKEGGLTVVTKDSDFADGRKHPGPPPKAVRLLIGNSTIAELEQYIRDHAAAIEAFVASGDRYREI